MCHTEARIRLEQELVKTNLKLKSHKDDLYREIEYKQRPSEEYENKIKLIKAENSKVLVEKISLEERIKVKENEISK